MAIIRVIDAEFEGKPELGGGVIELGYHDIVARDVDLAGTPINWEVGDGKSRLCNPGCPISPDAQAVHFIDEEDVKDAPDWRALMKGFLKQAKADGVIAFGAHNASAERAWVHPEWEGADIPFICSLKAAYWTWPTAPSFKNNGLRFWRRPEGLVREMAEPAHRAQKDAYTTAFHIRDLLNIEGVSVAQLIEWTNKPALLPRCKFGDYRDTNGGMGTPWAEVEVSLLHWVLGKSFDEDTMFTARYWLEKHEMDQREAEERRALNAQLEANGLPTEPVPGEAPARPLADENQGELIL
jgi:exodeoxyribonuclease X